MALLSRVADRLYWGARYVERVEDTARIVRSYTDLIVDLPIDLLPYSWEPLVAIAGSESLFGDKHGEHAVIEFLLADCDNPASMVSSVAWARENLRTTREVLPRDAWQAFNELQQHVLDKAERAVERRTRDRFLRRVIDDSRRLNGVLESTMTRAEPYRIWRLGQLIERADMTTRVLGVRAAAIMQMQTTDRVDDHDEVQWMGVLRSVSAMQMYQRDTRGPIEGASVVRFLLSQAQFPRSVLGCLDEMRDVLKSLPDPDGVISVLDETTSTLMECEAHADDGAQLDDALDEVQLAIADLDAAIAARYLVIRSPAEPVVAAPHPEPATAGGFEESPIWETGLRAQLLDVDRLVAWQSQVDRLLVAEGAGHLVHDLPVRADGRAASVASRPWKLDPIPLVVDTETFQWLSSAVIERMEALEEILRDLYGPRQLVRDGVVAADVLNSSDRYRLAAIGSTRSARWLTTYAVDIVHDADGAWRVVRDFTDAPPGVGYALLNRSVMSRATAELMASAGIASLARFPGQLRRALAASSSASSPRTVLFSGGIDHASYIEHSYLAVQLGVHLVEGADLVVRQRHLWLRTLDGLEPIDVVYRRLEDPDIDPLEAGAIRTPGAVGIPGLLLAARSGGVTLANAHGAGVVEDSSLSALWPAAARHVAGVELRLPQLDGARPQLATTPLFDGTQIRAGEVVLRLFAVHDGRTGSVMPGGSGHVLAPGDDPSLPTACVAKDVWVVGTTLTPFIAAPLPQVDFARSVPTSAADALYWTNRASERAEAMARTIGAISSRMEQDPGLVVLEGGRWSMRMQRIARGARRAGPPSDEETSDEVPAGLTTELAMTTDAIAREIGVLLAEATTVREYLSVTAGRILERLSNTRAALQQRAAEVDDLDSLLADFAALAGMWNESTVRGPAWRLGDAGRRIERTLVVLDLVEAGFESESEALDPVEAAVLEVILAANDNLVAYRRRHRSDVEPDAAFALLVGDGTNPRSVAASIERLGEHAADAEWSEGVAIAAAARDALSLPRAAIISSVRALMADASGKLNERWFATPVSPIVVVGR